MADDERRNMDTIEKIEYREGLEWLENFVENELGNGRTPRPRLDIGEWKRKRVETIQILNMSRKKLDAVCVGANYGKAGGNVAKILGASGAIIGAVIFFKGVPSGKMAVNTGILLCLTGTLIGDISNVIESAFSAKYLNDIEYILKEDQKLSLRLAEWLKVSSKLDETIQEIFGVSLTCEKYGTVIKVFSEFSTFLTSAKTSFDEIISLMRNGRYSVYIGNDVKIELLQKFFKQLSDFPQLAVKMRTTLFYLSELTDSFHKFINGVRAYRRFMGISYTSAVTPLQNGLNPETLTAGKVSVFCFFHSISLALSFMSLIKTTSIIEKGKSKYSDAINELTSLLDMELKQMEDLNL